MLSWLLAVVIALSPHPHHHHAHHTHLAHHRPATPKAYARRLVLHRWHSIRQWRALDEVVTPESGWDPCAYYPGQHDCRYRGIASCGIPQRNPCPRAWWGKLFKTRWAQVRWLIFVYIPRRYGDPLHALEFRELHGWY